MNGGSRRKTKRSRGSSLKGMFEKAGGGDRVGDGRGPHSSTVSTGPSGQCSRGGEVRVRKSKNQREREEDTSTKTLQVAVWERRISNLGYLK